MKSTYTIDSETTGALISIKGRALLLYPRGNFSADSPDFGILPHRRTGSGVTGVTVHLFLFGFQLFRNS